MEGKRLIDGLQLPRGLAVLPPTELRRLAAEIREVILETVPRTGGHLASNLGVVELTIALHRVFDFQKDRLVFDTGHQSYTHKILTGRLPLFGTLRQKDGLLGFPSPWESDFDPFITGHAGTSISSCLGLALGLEAAGTGGKSVCVIGDGAFCGLAFEAMNHAGELQKDMLVVLNDNRMAISPTVGAFSKHLNRLRSDAHYRHYREALRGRRALTTVGSIMRRAQVRLLELLRRNLVPGLIFKEMGFEYYGPVDGHDLEDLETILGNLKDARGPVLLHVLTEKGRGSPAAQSDPYKYHGMSKVRAPDAPTGAWYSQVFSGLLLEAARKDPRIFAITAAMAQGTNLEEFQQALPERFVDTGIAESHAVTMAGALEAAGMKPVVLIYSSFLQRSYDQIMHDLCLQKGGAVVLALDRAGVVGDDGPSHHGVFDVAYLRHLPRIELLAPRDGVELGLMLAWALSRACPVAIRYPRDLVPAPAEGGPRPPIVAGEPELLRSGTDLAILAYGSMVEQALAAARILEAEGLRPTLVNLRFAKPLSAAALAPILAGHRAVLTVEEHALAGGVGSAVLEAARDAGLAAGHVTRLGIPDAFVPHADRHELLAMLGLDAAGIAAAARRAVARGKEGA